MKKIIISFILIVMLLIVSTIAHAILIKNTNALGQHVVFDNRTLTYWYWDLSHFTGLTYTEQLNRTSDLIDEKYYNFKTWHMASANEIHTLSYYSTQEIRNAFNKSYEDYGDDGSEIHTWYGRYEALSANEPYTHLNAGTEYGIRGDPLSPYDSPWYDKHDNLSDNVRYYAVGSWAATDPVPEPVTILLLGSGLVGLAGFGRKKFFNK